ncbi:ATP-binding cassette subfamily B protein [Methylobacterium brachiatum]|uniref:ATP-binding cassette subfamily B protein n=1 Tax=Methylobacterium brachiatum TaxID=269660 RepID=A0AAJ1TV89_9HYPH|nr:ABC transporter ATP-binding protein [Methylobacterium brachiatum]MCB4802527.1 ABC transporter ATP-binding protein/permease [Methylobacterium brachiatum]MDQ0543153.1 ATP-binding cassette subfamily B protein [Methylobacterium brachiatum]
MSVRIARLGERLGALRYLPALFREIAAASPRLLAASLILRLVAACLPILSLYLAKLILDGIVAEHARPAPAAGLSDWLADPRRARLVWLVAAELGLALLSDLTGRLASLTETLIGDLYANAASMRLMAHAASLDLAQFEDSAQQDRLERARRQVSGRTGLIGTVFGQFQALVTLASLTAGVAAFTPWLVVLIAAALVPALLNEWHFTKAGYRLAWIRSPERRRIDYLRYLGASVETAKEVKLFGLSGYITALYGALAQTLLAENRALATARARWGFAFASLGTLAYYAAYAVIVWRTVAGAFSIGDLAFLAGAFQRLRGGIEGLLLGLTQISGQAQYLDDFFSFFAIRPEIRSPAQPVPVPSPIRKGLVFEDVGYRYPGTETWALRGLSFAVRAGETVALVGGNGAGKTTIVKLMTRLYDPHEGRVLLDGRPLAAYDLDDLRARVAVIFQDFVRFDLTAGENVAVGRIAAADDRDRIAAAAARGLAAPVIERLPEGYAQPLGKRFAGGVDLSGGEWQKVALSRAYMREAEILILDEPTAALDARAEHDVFARFRELSAGRTTVLISHRFSTVRMADRILVLEGGRLLEEGSHAALMGQGGRYAELFTLQAQGYR